MPPPPTHTNTQVLMKMARQIDYVQKKVQENMGSPEAPPASSFTSHRSMNAGAGHRL